MSDLQSVRDELDIQRTISNYAWGCDNQDWDLLRSCFSEDATLDYSSTGGPAGGKVEICQWLEDSLSQVEMIQHVVTNHQIDLDGDSAKVTSMFYCLVRLPGMTANIATGGYYNETFVRTAAGWKIQSLYEDNRWMDAGMADA